MSASGSLGAPPMRGFFGFCTTARFTAGRSIRVASAACRSPVSVGVVVSSVISLLNLSASPRRQAQGCLSRSSRRSRSSLVSYPSPARLRHAGQLAHERALTETDPAQPELAHVATRAAADLAPVVGLHLVLRRSLGLEDQAFLGHERG